MNAISTRRAGKLRRIVTDTDRGRLWFWKPQWHWFGWKSLLPFQYGHDQHARRVLVFGWTVTGRILFAVWSCGDESCMEEASR
jgi:hypothetical protein